jgi:hypothetical protein
MKSKFKPLSLLATLGLSALPATVLAHQGHANSVWHAVLHLFEANGLWLVLVSLAIIASFVWNIGQRRPLGALVPASIRKEQEIGRASCR